MKIKKAWLTIGALGLISVPVLANIGNFINIDNNTNAHEYLQHTRNQSGEFDVKAATQAIEQNLEINFSDAKYNDFENSPINLDPWKQLVGPNSVLNIKCEIIDLTNATSALDYSIPVMLTQIDETTGNLKEPIITSIDFWDNAKIFCGKGASSKPTIGGTAITKLYYSGGIYSETLNKFIVVIQAFVNETWRPILFKIDPNSGDGSTITFDKVENSDQLKTNASKASTSSNENATPNDLFYMYINGEIPFEYNVVPFANLTDVEQKQFDENGEVTYLNSSFFLVPWSAEYKLQNYFQKDGNLMVSGSNTKYTNNIFQTACTIDPASKKIVWQPKLIQNQEYADFIAQGNYNDKVLACRPLFFSYDNSEQNISSSINLIKLEGSVVNIDIVTGAGIKYGRDLIQYYANYKRIEKDGTIKSTFYLRWNLDTFDRTTLKFRPMIEIFKLNTANISNELTNAWMISFGFLNNVEDNGGSQRTASLLYNNLYVTKAGASDLHSSIYATNSNTLSFCINGWNKALMTSLWFDSKNKRITFFSKKLTLNNNATGAWEATNTLINLDYSYFMDFTNKSTITYGEDRIISFEQDPSAGINNNIFSNFITSNLQSYDFYYDNLGPSFDNSETVVIPFYKAGAISYFNPTTKNLTLTKTFMNQLANDVSTQQDQFSILQQTSKVEDISNEMIIEEIKANTAFKVTNIPSKLIDENTSKAYTYDQIINSFWEKLTPDKIKITSTPDEVANGTLRFQISYDGLIFDNGFNTIQNSNPIVNQSNTSNQEFVVYGFTEQTPTIINMDPIVVEGKTDKLASSFDWASAHEFIIIDKKDEIFTNLPKDTIIDINDPLDYSNEYKGEVIVTGTIDKYYNESGVLVNEPKEFTITLTGFKKFTTTWESSISVAGYETQLVNDLSNETLAQIITDHKDEIFKELPTDPLPSFNVTSFDTKNAFNGETKVEFTIQQGYVDGVLQDIPASITISGFKKYTTEWLPEYNVQGYSDKLTTDIDKSTLEKIINENKDEIFSFLPTDPIPTLTVKEFDNKSMTIDGKISVTVTINQGYKDGQLAPIDANIVLSGFKPDISLITTTITTPGVLSNVNSIDAAIVEDNNVTVLDAIIAANIIHNQVIGETITASDIQYTIISRIGKDGTIIANITINNSKAWENKVIKPSMEFTNIVLKGFGKTAPSTIPNVDPSQPEKTLEISTSENLDNLDPNKIQEIIKNEVNISGLPSGTEPKIEIVSTGSNDGTDFIITIDQYYDNEGNIAGPLVINGQLTSNYVAPIKPSVPNNNNELYWWIPLVASLSGFTLILIIWIIIFAIYNKKRGEY